MTNKLKGIYALMTNKRKNRQLKYLIIRIILTLLEELQFIFLIFKDSF